MALFQDNISPYISFVEGSAPSSPAATDFRLYFDSSDHLLKWKNSAGTVTAIATGTPLSNPMTTKGDVILGDTGGTATRLAAGATAGMVLTSAGSAAFETFKLPPGYEFDFAQNTASDPSITATTSATANTIVTGNAVTYDGSTIVAADVYMPAGLTDAGHQCRLVLYDNGSLLYDTIGWFGESAGQVYASVRAVVRFTPSNAAHTYSVRAYVSAGTTSIFRAGGGATACDLRITKV